MRSLPPSKPKRNSAIGADFDDLCYFLPQVRLSSPGECVGNQFYPVTNLKNRFSFRARLHFAFAFSPNAVGGYLLIFRAVFATFEARIASDALTSSRSFSFGLLRFLGLFSLMAFSLCSSTLVHAPAFASIVPCPRGDQEENCQEDYEGAHPSIHFAAFTFSPISTKRRMASERPGSSGCWAAQASTEAINSSDIRMVRAGSVPVGFRPDPGRFPPSFFGIAFFIIQYYCFQA